jgi:cytochrome c biogenesis factor
VTIVTLLLLIAAFICFLLGAFAHRAAAVTRVNLVAAGLAAWVLVPLLERLVSLD